MNKEVDRRGGCSAWRWRSCRLVGCVVLLVAFGPLVGGATDAELQSLIERSPFLPSDFRGDDRTRTQDPAPQTTPMSRNYRFTGVIGFRGERKFAFVNLREDRGYWIPEGQTVEGLRVLNFDASGRRVMLTDGSRSEWLPLERPERPVTEAPPPSRSEPSREGEARERDDETAEERPRAPVRRRVIVPSRSSDGA